MKKGSFIRTKNRENEKGAALVMALMVSFLLLTASIGLILESSMNTQNVTDVIAEQQAYSAAESGIQSAVHILRCQKNTNPGCADVRANPPKYPTASPSPALTNPLNQIDYKKAINPAESNIDADLNAPFRLSRWLNYHTITCGPTAVPCVPLNQPGYAYSLAISDPDNVSRYVSFSMTGKLYDSDTGVTNRKTYSKPTPDPINPTLVSYTSTLTITYIPPAAVVDHDMSGGNYAPPDGYGKFTVTKSCTNGTGTCPANYTVDIPSDNRFEIVVRMTRPYNAVKTIRGWIRANTATDGDPSPGGAPRVIFDSQTLTLVGSALTLDLGNAPSAGWSSPQIIDMPDPPIAGFKIGYQARAGLVGVGPTDNVIGGSISPPEPVRLLIKSTGYGPRGAKKQLETIIQKNFFNGLTAPAALTLVGPHRTAPYEDPNYAPESHFFFALGDSSALQYSGQDQVSTDIIPPVGTSNPVSQECVDGYIQGIDPDPSPAPCFDSYPHTNVNAFHGTVEGTPSDVSSELPYWLETPQALDAEVHQLASTARSSGRFFPNGVVPTSWGDVNTGTGITFCDGDVELGNGITGDGGGILVVTGALTLRGAFNFKGLIIVTGPGGLLRSGGGGGDAEITGNVIVAPYVNSKIVDRTGPDTDDPAGIFLGPHYDMTGGGNSNLQFNSQSLANSLTAVSNFVLGVMEK